MSGPIGRWSLTPSLVIMPPHADALARLSGGYEARKNGSFRVRRRDRDDVRQHSLEPRHFPFRSFGEHPLHIDAKVDRVSPGGPYLSKLPFDMKSAIVTSNRPASVFVPAPSHACAERSSLMAPGRAPSLHDGSSPARTETAESGFGARKRIKPGAAWRRAPGIDE